MSICSYKNCNVFKQTLKEITDYGFRIKHFRDYSPLCLVGEDLNFIKNLIQLGKTIFQSS